MIIPKKLPKDPNQRAHAIARMLTKGPQPGEIVTEQSEHMAKIGKKGGRSRRDNLSSEERSQIARKAAHARWKT